MNQLYTELVEDIYENGTILTKKDGTTLKEIIPATIEISNPKHAILTQPFRMYNPAFMVAECLWNLCGDKTEWLADYNWKYRKYFKEGILEAGYGNRIINGSINQLEQVVNLLKDKPDTSRATISIFNAEEDYKETNFVPCISFLKFRILEDSEGKKQRLYMWSFMRAQDIWKGFPYDIFLLLSIFQYVAETLGMEMGSYFHVCDTIRLYSEDMTDIEYFMKNAKTNVMPGVIELKNNNNCTRFSDFQKYRDLIMNDVYDLGSIASIPEYWKNAILTCWTYKNIKVLKYEDAYILLKMITNEFAQQTINWSRRYNRSFYEFYESKGKNMR